MNATDRLTLLRLLDSASAEDLDWVRAFLEVRSPRAEPEDLDDEDEEEGLPPRRPPGRPRKSPRPAAIPEGEALVERRRRVGELLSSGALNRREIVVRARIAPGPQLDAVLDCDHFSEEGGLWRLTPAGRQAYC